MSVLNVCVVANDTAIDPGMGWVKVRIHDLVNIG